MCVIFFFFTNLTPFVVLLLIRYELQNRLSGTKHELFTLARSRTNPFDKIGQAIFISRAATKLAVLDVHFNLLASPDPNQVKDDSSL